MRTDFYEMYNNKDFAQTANSVGDYCATLIFNYVCKGLLEAQFGPFNKNSFSKVGHIHRFTPQ